MKTYICIPSVRVVRYGPCAIARPARKQVTADSPATKVMTDLLSVPAATIEPSKPFAGVNEYMSARGVRSLLVLSKQDMLVGLITASDVLGERPVLRGAALGLKRDELLVEHVMTPIDAIEAMTYSDVLGARVGDVITTLNRAGRQHALVMQTPHAGESLVRGIFSTTQIARQLGIVLQPSGVARSFAELVHVLA